MTDISKFEEIREQKKLVAKLRESDKAKIKAGDKLMLLISVGINNFNKEAIMAMVILLNEIYDESSGALMFVLNVADTLQRFNIAAINSSEPEIQTTRSLCNGDQWLQDVNPVLAGLKGTKHIIRWNHWRLHHDYLMAKKKVLDLGKNYSKEFYTNLNDSINEYVERQRRNLGEEVFNPIEEKYRKYCEEYLMEEIVTMLLWKETGCKFILYPGKQTAIMDFILEKLVHPENPNLLQWLSIRLQRVNNQMAVSKARNALFLEKVIASTIGNIYWKDKGGVYLGCNDNQAKILGYKSGRDIIGKTDFDLPWKEQASFLRKIDIEVVESKKPYSVEEPVIIDGQMRVFLSKKAPLEDETGGVIGVLGISIDITDRKKAELLEEEKKVTSRVSQAIEMLSGSIAHEMRTPLAAINTCIDNMSVEFKNLFIEPDKIEYKNKFDDFVKKIKSTVYNGTNIVSMLLVKLRSVLNKSEDDIKNFEILSIRNCINQAINEYPFLESQREIIICNNPDMDFSYKGSTLLTKHILFNLIKNTLRAIKEAGKGEIYIDLKSDKKFNYLVYKDTASGIPSSKIGSIFQQFSSSSKGGTGLGLPFCKITMQSYGGDIVCASKEGEYTEFTLSFPKIMEGS